ncbi:MAG: phage tail protein [Pseudonocardiaceae bacterium]
MPARCSVLATCDQWARAHHVGTAVDGAPGAVTLSWHEPDDGARPEGDACPARGLAMDRLCRVYRLGRRAIERLVVGPTRGGLDYVGLRDPVVIMGGEGGYRPATVDFRPAPEPELVDATGIAVDADDRLFVSDRGRRHLAVIDLWNQRTLRVIGTAVPGAPDRHPMGLAAGGQVVLAVLRRPAGLLRLTATRGPEEVALPGTGSVPPGSEPSRVAVLPDGAPVVLWHAPDGAGWLGAGDRPPERVGAASDIAVDLEGTLVVAPCAGGAAALRRLVPTASGWTRALPLDASGYDGSGIVATADGRIGYWTIAGFRLAVRGRVRYARDGVCVTYRLDAGVPRNRWGRVVLDVCLPPGTDCRIATVTTDDEFDTAVAPAPALPAACEPADPSATPALPPRELMVTAGEVVAPLHRRRDAPTPWWRPAPGDQVDVFEAPVLAPPGRFLWVTLSLRGDGRTTPVIRELRVEHQAHDLLRRLPVVFTEDEPEPSFLHRYLAMFEALLRDLDLRSACRDLLIDPASTPIEALDWLASFVGLVLDDRWHEVARRRLVAEIVPLYRRRGTVWALSRYIELFLAGAGADEQSRPGVAPVIVEHFRLRGVGPVLGGDPQLSSRAVVGTGFRIGGEIGSLRDRPLDPDDDRASALAASAHRFSVLVTRPLGIEQEAAVRHILDTERPAHTGYELCTVDAGMRVGDGLHLGLSSVVGPTGAFDPAITGTSLLGRGTLLGGPTTGLAVEAARLGTTSRVG